MRAFRVWDRHCKIMCYDPFFSFPLTLRLSEAVKISQEDGWIWMQDIGLKDKNGKKIYEGDILQCQGEYNYLIDQKLVTSCGCCILVYGWKIFNGNSNEDEIIGNIYENPELLENIK